MSCIQKAMATCGEVSEGTTSRDGSGRRWLRERKVHVRHEELLFFGFGQVEFSASQFAANYLLFLCRSSELANICGQRGFECMVCDNLHLPYRSACVVRSWLLLHERSPRLTG